MNPILLRETSPQVIQMGMGGGDLIGLLIAGFWILLITYLISK